MRQYPSELEMHIPSGPVTSLLGIHLKHPFTRVHNDVSTRLFLCSVFFLRARFEMTQTCPSTGNNQTVFGARLHGAATRL